MSNSAVIYRGPSMLDGAPIVVVATGLGRSSRNGKTGELVQTWIIREDISPVEAVKTGADASICGACLHRGAEGRARSCYVQVFQAPRSVWESYHRGIYPVLDLVEARAALAGKRVRLGAYGDPAAVPFDVWESILVETEARTGYTHQWRDCDARFASYVMASCDTPADYDAAKAAGYRTFRVRLAGDATMAREVVCPASKEAGNKTNCASCIACGGHKAKAKADIVIMAHGSAAITNAYRALRAA